MCDPMFCFQCQEAAGGVGCKIKGVCGKDSTLSKWMDLLLFSVRGISVAATHLRAKDIAVDNK
ncbi:MAG: hydroxylamine reductase, partial [Bacteroidaceae bacterium]|nr:hydroxylamine reductase [Bacteroidaceae bacterium]